MAEIDRRSVLLSAGALGTVLGLGRRWTAPGLDVSIWLSDDAVARDGVRDRVVGVLGAAFEEAGVAPRFSFGPRPVALDVEQGRGLMTVRWPRMVVEGHLGRGPIRPPGDVTLLVTDGDPTTRPAGYGMRGVAAVTGARYLAELPPSVRGAAAVDPTLPAVVAQLVLHEVGHAVGLHHKHGSVSVEGDAVVASPMVGAYAWAEERVRRRQLGSDANICGGPLPPIDGLRRQLSLVYADCERSELRRRGGGSE